jgi:hypothetical protein
VIKELENPVFGDVIETKLGHVPTLDISEVTEEQLKTVSIRKDRVPTHASRTLQVIAEE